jgi:vancomycin resistance protein YoaR
VAPGETFSFNDAIGPVLAERGWKEALGIFGSNVKMTVGGGICQVVTTIYRAALLAGLPIKERAHHSQYVRYYEKYGVGIDATIFQGIKNLQFVNDTEHYILIQGWSRGNEAYVHIYGTSDGRTVTMQGPFFYDTPRTERSDLLPELFNNQIGWVRRIHYADGTEKSGRLVSTYQKPWKRLSASTLSEQGKL